MDRKSVIVVVALVVLVAGFLTVRDPVAAAETVRTTWDLLASGVNAVVGALSTFFEHLFNS